MHAYVCIIYVRNWSILEVYVFCLLFITAENQLLVLHVTLQKYYKKGQGLVTVLPPLKNFNRLNTYLCNHVVGGRECFQEVLKTKGQFDKYYDVLGRRRM